MDEIIDAYLDGLEIPKDELTALERADLLKQNKEVDRPMAAVDSGETLAPLIG